MKNFSETEPEWPMSKFIRRNKVCRKMTKSRKKLRKKPSKKR